MKYHSGRIGCLTSVRDPDQGQCLVGSLTGAVASKNVTEALKGSLSLVGNQVSSVSARELDWARGCLDRKFVQGCGAAA